MSLDIKRLENVVRLPDGRIRARCPACAAAGGDNKGEHLMVFEDGRFGCAANMGDHVHRAKIFRLAGARAEATAGGRVAGNKAIPRPVTISKSVWGGWGG